MIPSLIWVAQLQRKKFLYLRVQLHFNQRGVGGKILSWVWCKWEILCLERASVQPLHHVGSMMSPIYPCHVYVALCLRDQCRLLQYLGFVNYSTRYLFNLFLYCSGATFIYMYIRFKFTYIYICPHIYKWIYVYVYTCVCIYTYMYIHVYVWMCTYTCVYTHP